MRHAVAVLLAAWIGVASAAAAGRDVAIIIDTSGSMNDNDRERYTVQIAQIVSDLLDPSDRLTIIRMPSSQTCGDGPNPALMLRLDTNSRAAFKSALNAFIVNSGGTYFAAPVRTAIDALSFDRSRKRLLLVLADAGGLGECDQALSADLARLHASGATVAAVNLGATAGAFERNPAFDFTAAARSSEELIRAVARVYQRFLGAQQVQTGAASGPVRVDVSPGVREAFLVVAADGAIGEFEVDPSSPSAESIDPDYRGGGAITGLDGRTRAYRIIRLRRPEAGAWTFTPTGVAPSGGWMLLQDFAIALRFRSPSTFIAGQASPIEVEAYDEDTGRTLTDLSKLPGMTMTAAVAGQTIPLRDDGQNGDATAGDGVFSGTVTWPSPGSGRLDAHLSAGTVERRISADATAIDAGWILTPMTPPRVDAGLPLTLKVRADYKGTGAPASRPPSEVIATIGTQRVTLNDAGRDGDEAPGDRLYGGRWTPMQVGRTPIQYAGVGGGPAPAVEGAVEVLGRIEFGPAIPIALGTLREESRAEHRIDLANAQVFGDFELQVTSTFARDGVVIEVDSGEGWQRLTSRGARLLIEARGRRTWPVRARVGGCPEAVGSSERLEVTVRTTTAAGTKKELQIPLLLVVEASSWLHCWWPLLALIALLALAAFIAYGYWSPHRFHPQAGVEISDVADMNEAFRHPLRAAKGSGAGFYRDARIFIRSDYRLGARAGGGIAELRARPRQIAIRPVNGATLQRRLDDGEWEEVPATFAPARAGVIYRTGDGTLYFEVRPQ